MELLASWLAATPSFAEPYALAALGLILSERAGVLSLGAEGFMLVGALAAIAACLSFGCGPLLAIIAALLVTAVASALFAFVAVFLRVNQAITGLATVFLFGGLTDLVGTLGHWGNRAVTGLNRVPLGQLAHIPIVGPMLFDQDFVIYLTVPIFLVMQLFLSHSMLGLRLKAVGDSPETADAAGINVGLYRFGAAIVGSAIVGGGGAYLALADVKVWEANLANGRGWIAIALVIFARWRPWRALGGAVLFGGIEALIPSVAAAGFQVPQYFMLMTPYIATLAVMVWVGYSKQAISGAPLALGHPFVREERR
jgi:general nucleoside transport system permease protein